MSHKKGKLENCRKRLFLKDKNYWVVMLLQLFSLYIKEMNLKRQNHEKKEREI